MQVWTQWPRSRTVALVVAGVLVGILVGGFALLNRPAFVPIYSRLDVEEAARVVEALGRLGIPYRLTGAGTTVEVPQDRVYAARLQLAAQGLPRGGSLGFEIFDRPSFTTTELVQRVNVQRALAGELVRSIETLEEIESARVHLVIPQERLFTDSAPVPSAAVVVRLRPGAALTAVQVRAIRHLVANSVEGLSPERVTIVDAQGRLLASGREESTGLAATQLAEREQVEFALQQRVQTLLDETLGPGRAIARVSADLDTSRRQIEQESYLPAQRAPTSEVAVEESYTGRGGIAPGGPASTAIPSYTTTPPGGGTSEYRRRETRTTYQVTRRIEREVATGGIRRLSVAVVVDRNVPTAVVRALETAVAAGVGLDRRRGDVLVVQTVSFPTPEGGPKVPAPSPPPLTSRKSDALWPFAAAVGIVLLGVLGLLVRRRRRPRVTVETLQPAPVAAIPEPEPKDEEKILRVLQQREDPQVAAVRQEVQRLAQERPEDLAAILKGWMSGA
jgi:flagellar M-ring protein FliF